MSGKSRSTGISKIDADVAKILKMPMRDTKKITQLEKDFPGTTITSNTLEIFVVGAGWNFVSSVLGLVAAGAKVVAYEKNMENIARGEATSLKLAPYFDFFDACYQPLLMPELSPEQLERLPDVITKIAGDSCYRFAGARFALNPQKPFPRFEHIGFRQPVVCDGLERYLRKTTLRNGHTGVISQMLNGLAQVPCRYFNSR